MNRVQQRRICTQTNRKNLCKICASLESTTNVQLRPNFEFFSSRVIIKTTLGKNQYDTPRITVVRVVS